MWKVQAAMTTELDYGVGNITAALKEMGLWENTFLALWSDNGGSSVFVAIFVFAPTIFSLNILDTWIYLYQQMFVITAAMFMMLCIPYSIHVRKNVRFL